MAGNAEHVDGFPAGRDGELAVLADALARLAGGRGGSVLVEGEPGIGKSALAAAALAGLPAVDMEVLRGGCDELGRRFPLSVLVAALGVSEESPDPDRAAVARALGRSAEPSGERPPMVDQGDGASAAIEHLAELVDRLCARRPVLLVVDDLQWADEPSLSLWTQLSRAAAQLPLLLIGLCRRTPDPDALAALHTELSTAGHGTVLELGPLESVGVTRLAARLSGGEPGPALTRLLESAAGNPLYIREIIDAVTRSGELRALDGVAELAPTSDPAVASLAGAIADRLDFLSPRCRAVLQAAALHGVEVTADAVAELASLPVDEVRPMFLEAIAAGVVEAIGHDAVRFRHGLIRQSLFESMPEALRVAMYRDAARQLIRSGAPVERTAEAVLRALDVADGWELDWLARNAEALAYRAPALAIVLFEHALAHSASADARAEQLEDQLATVLFLMGRYEEAERLTRGVLAVATEPERRGWASWVLAHLLQRLGRYDESLALVAEAGENASPLWTARLSMVRAMVFNRIEQPKPARAAAEEALVLGEGSGDVLTIGYALHLLALRCITEGDQAGSLVHMERALGIMEGESRLDDLRAMVLTNRATVLDVLERHEEAVASLRSASVLSERSGTTRVSMLRVHTSIMAFNRGHWDDSVAELDALTTPEAFVDLPVMYHGMCALIAVHRDDADTLARHLRALDEIGEVGWPSSLGPAMAARAFAAERDGRLGDALDIFRVFVDPDDDRFHETRVDWLPILTRLALAADDAELAGRALDAAREEFEQEPLSYKEAMYGWCLGLVQRDPVPVLAAVEYFRGAHRIIELGTALEDAAELLASAGDTDGARAALAESVAGYAELDAAWDAQRAASRLRGHGVRLGVRGPRRRPRHGWAALTDTELRVAELAAAGMSNPDIAGRLLLSRRTVQTHVSHILAKLGAHSRREIAEYAPAVG